LPISLYYLFIKWIAGIDRLYGGSYYDFQSGGQWTNLVKLYDEIRFACEASNMEMIFFFNGTSPQSYESHEWMVKQKILSDKIKHVFENFVPAQKATFK
jgi:hypothetical protein